MGAHDDGELSDDGKPSDDRPSTTVTCFIESNFADLNPTVNCSGTEWSFVGPSCDNPKEGDSTAQSEEKTSNFRFVLMAKKVSPV